MSKSPGCWELAHTPGIALVGSPKKKKTKTYFPIHQQKIVTITI